MDRWFGNQIWMLDLGSEMASRPATGPSWTTLVARSRLCPLHSRPSFLIIGAMLSESELVFELRSLGGGVERREAIKHWPDSALATPMTSLRLYLQRASATSDSCINLLSSITDRLVWLRHCYFFPGTCFPVLALVCVRQPVALALFLTASSTRPSFRFYSLLSSLQDQHGASKRLAARAATEHNSRPRCGSGPTRANSCPC